LEEDKKRIIQDKNIAQEQKEKLLQEAEQKLSQLKKEEAKKKKLAEQIEAMQSKLLVGGRTIQDHTTEQEKELERKNKLLAEQRQLERKMQQKLMQQEESTNEAQDSYSSLRQEVDDKTKKLKKLYAKLMQVKTEIDDMRLENTKEREKLELMQMEMTRELKFKTTIIENFIPNEDIKKLDERIVYDEETEAYSIRPISLNSSQSRLKRPQSAHVKSSRPVSQYARMAASAGFNPRYRGENVLLVDLDMPVRTTKDYLGPAVAPKVQAALEAALQEEDDIDVDAASHKFMKMKPSSANRVKSSRPKSSRQVRKSTTASSGGSSKELYPESRGLVPK